MIKTTLFITFFAISGAVDSNDSFSSGLNMVIEPGQDMTFSILGDQNDGQQTLDCLHGFDNGRESAAYG